MPKPMMPYLDYYLLYLLTGVKEKTADVTKVTFASTRGDVNVLFYTDLWEQGNCV